jgi:hypothetical protein
MRWVWYLAPAVVAFGAAACDPDRLPERCDVGFADDGPLTEIDGGELVPGLAARITAVEAVLAGVGSDGDGGVSIPVTIAAAVPCLIGGLNAKVTTSRGTIGSVGPGATATVFLAPTALGRYSGQLFGETTLILPEQQRARIEVSVADAYATLYVFADGTTDGGATTDAGAPTDATVTEAGGDGSNP